MSTATAVRERPILMSGPMVRAILEGRKTQTRRVIMPIPPEATTSFAHIGVSLWACIGNNGPNRTSPHGAVGDQLWVRETFMGPDHIGDGDQGCVGFGVLYRADDSFVEDPSGCACEGPCNGVRIAHPWKPSIFMPRRYSRLSLEITGVRVERVQEISQDDAKAEGVDAISDDVPRRGTLRRRDDYRQLWDSLNAKRGYGWDVNPWVFVIEFRRVTA